MVLNSMFSHRKQRQLGHQFIRNNQIDIGEQAIY